MWREPRLEIPRFFLNDFNSSSGLSQGSMIPVNLELVNQLWLPNIFIYNLKTFKVNTICDFVSEWSKSYKFAFQKMK